MAATAGLRRLVMVFEIPICAAASFKQIAADVAQGLARCEITMHAFDLGLCVDRRTEERHVVVVGQAATALGVCGGRFAKVPPRGFIQR